MSLLCNKKTNEQGTFPALTKPPESSDFLGLTHQARLGNIRRSEQPSTGVLLKANDV